MSRHTGRVRGRFRPRNQIKNENFLNIYQVEGSYWRSGVGREFYRGLQDNHRYVLFGNGCGKIKTFQQPDGQPAGIMVPVYGCGNCQVAVFNLVDISAWSLS